MFLQGWQKLKSIFIQIILEKDDQKLIDFLKTKKNTGTEKDLKILIQMPESYYYLALFSLLILSFKKRFRLNIDWVQVMPEFTVVGKLKTLRSLPLFQRRWRKLYTANSGAVKINNLFHDWRKKAQLSNQAQEIFSQLKTKDDVLNISRNNILLGDLIYDTYLRYKPAATADIKDPLLLKIIDSAFHIQAEDENYFDNNHPDFVISSYSAYIHHGIIIRVALHRNIKVMTLGTALQLLTVLKKDFPNHSRNHSRYLEEFDELPAQIKDDAEKKAEEVLLRRINGEIDHATSYMRQSAYSSKSTEKMLQESSRPKIIFFLHCFFDSPHAYRTMIFPDFYEWITQSLEALKDKDYDVYIKPHPNGTEGNKPIVEEIFKKFPFAKKLPASANNAELAREGFTAAFTVYGTIAHELSYLGIPVVSAGDNPHSSFNFLIEPKNKKEYMDIINDVTNLPAIAEDYKRQIFRFVYIHSLHPVAQSPIPINAMTAFFKKLRVLENSAEVFDFINDTQNQEIMDQALSEISF